MVIMPLRFYTTLSGNSLNNNDISQVKVYEDAYDMRNDILKENKGKSGIYMLTNKLTNDIYIGQSADISKRFKNYFNFSYIKSKDSFIISRALLKYGYSNFSVTILEYCDKSNLIVREQYYFNKLNPQYNILKIAGSSTGFKHSPETLLKFKNRKLNPEALANLKRSKAGLAPSSPLRKINHMLATGHVTTVINNKDNVVKVYESIRAAAKDIGVSRQTLSKYVNKDKLLKGIYMVIGKI